MQANLVTKCSQHMICCKVSKFPLAQVMKALRGSRGIAQLFNLGTKWKWDQQHATPTLPQGRRSGNHCTAGWVDPRSSLDGYGKSRPHWNLIPGQSSPQWVTI